ncbi:MAG TPA: tyrosine-type recombinase/integrase [Treponemataceae bacterium]|nr:tyrosine-type recombinase/integrase [Treponemataceae bacterium]
MYGEEGSSCSFSNKKTTHTLATLIDEYIAYIDGVRNLSACTVESYKNDLKILVELLSKNIRLASKNDITVSDITIEDLRRCIGILSKEKKAAASINRFISVVRNFFAYCRRFSYITNNEANELKMVKTSIKVPQFMTEGEVDLLCTQPHSKNILWQSRDTALFAMLYSSGCRVSEMASLKMADFSGLRDSAMITGKGGKDRRVYFSDDAVSALNMYLPERKAKLQRLRKSTHAVFISQKATSLTSGGIQYIVRRYSSVEGSNKPVTPHAFRHTFATQLLNNGADVRVVQELLGHASISTTQRYTHITDKHMIELYKKAHPHGDE